MHLCTITVHSHLFGGELEEAVLEEMASVVLSELHKSLEIHGLQQTFTIEAYWGRGSLVEHFLLFVEDKKFITAAGSLITLKTLKDYPELRAGIALVMSDLKKVGATVKGVPLKIKDVWLSATKPTNGTKQLRLPLEANGDDESA
ncbi:hypothetical protein [uncultured Abyssibacter sp.]|uniref:hypothetical protein n=1 Tax=uncultured Abyssibacter sp. TaxID=2320202 RepID=UPI0032B1348E